MSSFHRVCSTEVLVSGKCVHLHPLPACACSSSLHFLHVQQLHALEVLLDFCSSFGFDREIGGLGKKKKSSSLNSQISLADKNMCRNKC